MAPNPDTLIGIEETTDESSVNERDDTWDGWKGHPLSVLREWKMKARTLKDTHRSFCNTPDWRSSKDEINDG